MIEKPLDSITADDLTNLVAAGTAERKTMDFKRTLHIATDAQKKELLADLCSFANAAGGDVIVGIVEQAGKAKDIVGISEDDVDALILRIENTARDGIRPRIPGLASRGIPSGNGKSCVVVRIPRSWMAPHMVTYQGASRFWARDTRGKYPLDIDGIRALVLQSELANERVKTFRAERIVKLLEEDAPIPLGRGGIMAVHLVPLTALGSAPKFDITALKDRETLLEPLSVNGWDSRYNFDGFLTLRSCSEEGDSSRQRGSYVQLFRNGTIEAASTTVFDENPRPYISSIGTEREIIDVTTRFLRVQRALGVTPPIVLAVSLLRVRGFEFAASFAVRLGYDDPHLVDRDHLLFPEELVESYDSDASHVVRPILDALWMAVGFPRSPSYDQSGCWKPPGS